MWGMKSDYSTAGSGLQPAHQEIQGQEKKEWKDHIKKFKKEIKNKWFWSVT